MDSRNGLRHVTETPSRVTRLRDFTVPAARTRYLLVHYHFFKNGGSTIEAILEREFPGSFATLHGSSPESVLDGLELAVFAAENPQVAAISSHHLRHPLPSVRDTVFFDWCFLRHPLARLQSMYTYLHKAKTADVVGQWALQNNASLFFRKLVEKYPHLISNVQLTLLANGGRFTRPAGEDDLPRATACVREMAVPGLVERFDESLTAAEYFLQPAFPDLRLHYVRRNASRPAEAASADDERYWRETWGEDVYADLLRLNQFDLRLYEAARDEVSRRFALVPDAARKLADFKQRCAQLATAEGRGNG